MRTIELRAGKPRKGLIESPASDQPDELIVLCASYEERALTTVQCLSESYRARKAVVYVNEEFLVGAGGAPARQKAYQLVEHVARHCERVDVAEGSLYDPHKQLNALRSNLSLDETHGHQCPVTIDTTTFNREALIVCCALLKANFRRVTIRTVYVSPISHGSWLSRGFRTVRNVIGFSGIYDSTRPTTLVVLTGFEPERVSKVIEEHEPDRVLLGIGDPPTSRNFLSRNLTEQELILARQDVEEFRFPTTNVKECLERLKKVTAPIADSNVIIAPMSTKMSTLAVWQLAEMYPEIQITYCVPGEYNVFGYSTGSHSVFVDRVSG